MKKLLIVAGVLMVAGAAGYYLKSSPAGSGTGQAAYENVQFKRERIEKMIQATGVVSPRNRLELKPPVGGRIEEVFVEEGQHVRKSDAVARMSSTERAALLDAARARGDATLRKWEDAYKATTLLAPLDGTIIARNIEPGQTVTAADAVMVLSDRLIISARVDETDIGLIAEGQAARIVLDAYRGRTVSGVVRRIAYDAVTVNNVTIYTVDIEPAEIPKFMKSGMTASVSFMLAEVPDALTLPVDAVQTAEGKSTVLVGGADAATPPRCVRILTGLTSGGRVEVLAGLDGTESVLKKEFQLKVAEDAGTSPFMPGPPVRKK